MWIYNSNTTQRVRIFNDYAYSGKMHTERGTYQIERERERDCDRSCWRERIERRESKIKQCHLSEFGSNCKNPIPCPGGFRYSPMVWPIKKKTRPVTLEVGSSPKKNLAASIKSAISEQLVYVHSYWSLFSHIHVGPTPQFNVWGRHLCGWKVVDRSVQHCSFQNLLYSLTEVIRALLLHIYVLRFIYCCDFFIIGCPS